MRGRLHRVKREREREGESGRSWLTLVFSPRGKTSRLSAEYSALAWALHARGSVEFGTRPPGHHQATSKLRQYPAFEPTFLTVPENPVTIRVS
jgi:hypothetical protein